MRSKISGWRDGSLYPVAGRAARRFHFHAAPPAPPAPRPPSPDVARSVALFNRRDWDGLRAMQADDVRLIQSKYPLPAGAADLGPEQVAAAKVAGK